MLDAMGHLIATQEYNDIWSSFIFPTDDQMSRVIVNFLGKKQIFAEDGFS